MPDVKLNGLKNRLYITLKNWDQADMRAYVQHIESACRTLVSGFTCLIVLRKNGLVRQKDKDLLFSTTDLISAYGAGKIVYVRKSGDNPYASHSNPFKFQTFIPVEHAVTVKDAEKILDGKTPRDRSLKAFQAKESRQNLWAGKHPN